MSPLRPSLMALSLVAALSGCMMGPDYTRPETATALPDAFVLPTPLAASPSAAGQWWSLFGDARLDELVTQALANSPDARIAAARIEESEALLRQVNAALQPEVDGTVGTSRTRSSQTTAVPGISPLIRNDTKFGLTTSFELDFWGKLRRASEAARAQALGTRYASDTVSLSLAAAVTQAYLNLRSLDAQLRVSSDSVTSQRRSVQLTKSRFEGGVASQLDVQQAEASLAATSAQQLGIEKARSLAQNLLGYLVGQPGLKIAPGDLASLPVPPVPPAGLPSDLLDARPDLRQAETDLIAANAKVGVAKAQLFPSITLTGNLGRESKDLSQLFSAPSAIWSFGAGLTQPIFEGGRLRAQVDQVTAQQKQSLESYRKAVQGAFRDVNDALVNVRQTGEAEVAYAQAMKSARRSQELAQIRYDGGYAGFLDVLVSQRTANDATLAYVQNRQARLAASVDLFKALGGGWKAVKREG